jgi:hypothetical protein
MSKTTIDRAKRVLGTLGLSIILGGGAVALVTLQPNPVLWPPVCRPLAIIITFLFFQWLYRTESRNSDDNPGCKCGVRCQCKN